VELRDVRFAHGGGPLLIDLPLLQVAAGEHVLLTGRSGSGKSTLLGLLAGVHQAQQGEVHVADHPLHALGGSARDQVRADHCGVVFQQFNLLPFLSVRDNILLPLRFSRRRRERVAADPVQAVIELLDSLQLDAQVVMARRAGTLSVGQQQRVAVARALIGQPEVILADEPTSALDASAAKAFLHRLFAQCRAAGAASIVVSHDLSLRHLFDRVIDLESLNRVGNGDAHV